MRPTNAIMREIQEVKKIIFKEENLKANNIPIHPIILISFNQINDRYIQLLEELKEAYQHENKHAIKFIIKNVTEHANISVERFAQSIMAFQELIQGIGNELFRLDKNELNLSFSNTFKGSFGILLNTEKTDMELISKSYNTFSDMIETLSSLNDDNKFTTLMKTKLNNKKLLKKYKDFYQIQAKYNNDIEIEWGDTVNINTKIFITKERFVYIADSLLKYEYIPDEHISETFIIKGISLIKKRLELQNNEKTIYPICDDEKLDIFLDKTKLEPEKAAGIIQKLGDLFPKSTTTYEHIDVYVQSEEPACVSFSKENIQSFGNVKRTIIEQTKEEFENEISGLLGAVEVWNKEEPKFKIKTDTGKRKTICYEASEENEKKVKSMIGKNVKIQISQDGKSNILERWLA